MKRNYFVLLMVLLSLNAYLQSMESAGSQAESATTGNVTKIYDEDECDTGALRAKRERDQGRPKSAYSSRLLSVPAQSAVPLELFARGSQAFVGIATSAQAPAVPDDGLSSCMEAGYALGHRRSLPLLGEPASLQTSRPIEKLPIIVEEALASSQSNESPGLLAEDSLDALLKKASPDKPEGK